MGSSHVSTLVETKHNMNIEEKSSTAFCYCWAGELAQGPSLGQPVRPDAVLVKAYADLNWISLAHTIWAMTSITSGERLRAILALFL